MIEFDNKTVSNIVATLETVEVRGSSNMARILGVIQVLKKALNKTEGQAPNEAEKE